MNATLLPVFGGELHEPWELHELRLLSWLRVHQIQEDNDQLRIDCLILSLKSNSTPLSWFHAQPSDLRSSFVHALSLLRNKYGSDLRKEMQRLSALNCLEVRSFRDSEHKTEMVFELINELEQLLTCGSVDQDVQRREYLLRCFRGFSGALKMMNRTTSYDGAVLAALNWESSVISKAEEAMIQAGIKRQLGQKSQNAQTRTKRKSTPNRPVNQPMQQEAGELNNNFTTQDFQANMGPIRLHPDVYHKTHPPSSQEKPFQNSSHPLQQRYGDNVDYRKPGYNQENLPNKPDQSNHTVYNASSASATAYAEPPPREDTDPSQMMESLVDPHIGTEQFPNSYAQRFDDQPNNYERLAQMNPNEQEVLNNTSYPPKFQMKPLVYDPKKNPYPPPEQLPENRNPGQQQFSSFPIPHLLEKTNQNLTTSANQQSTQPARLQANGNRPTNPSQPDSIPFPSATARGPALPSFQPTRNSPIPPKAGESQPQSAMMLPGSSSSSSHQHGTLPNMDSAVNFEGYANTTPAQFSFHPLSQRRSTGTLPAPQRRPSKLVKLRRNESSSSNNSSVGQRSSSSLRQIRNFIGAINRRRSQVSQSGDESDSTQDYGPNTPSPLDPGGIGSGLESDGNERIRPMQIQFSRLFRKHNHPEHLRQANRSMLVSKHKPGTENQKTVDNSKKGKARALDVTSAADGVVEAFFSQRGQTGKRAGLKHDMSGSPHAQASSMSRSRTDGGSVMTDQKNQARSTRWRTSVN